MALHWTCDIARAEVMLVTPGGSLPVAMPGSHPGMRRTSSHPAYNTPRYHAPSSPRIDLLPADSASSNPQDMTGLLHRTSAYLLIATLKHATAGLQYCNLLCELNEGVVFSHKCCPPFLSFLPILGQCAVLFHIAQT